MNKQQPKLTERHDYLSVNFGNGRVFTVSFSGSRGTNLPEGIADKIYAFVEAEKKKSNYGTAIKNLIDQIDTIWPEWNAEPPQFKTDDPVIGPRNAKGRIIGKQRTNYKVQFEGERCVTIISPWLLKKA